MDNNERGDKSNDEYNKYLDQQEYVDWFKYLDSDKDAIKQYEEETERHRLEGQDFLLDSDKD